MKIILQIKEFEFYNSWENIISIQNKDNFIFKKDKRSIYIKVYLSLYIILEIDTKPLILKNLYRK